VPTRARTTARRLTSRSPAQTRRLGRQIGECAQPGDVICLEGPLGTGKTVFVQGVAAGLGVAQSVTSPSFVIAHEYRGRLPLYHIDLYRLARSQAADLGLEQYLEGGGVTIVEWGERLPEQFRADCLEAEMTWGRGDNDRRIRFSACGERSARLLQSALAPPRKLQK
jgi:tRNA threonylcarbamoyladenosine biosynthesis protein TsaE